MAVRAHDSGGDAIPGQPTVVWVQDDLHQTPHNTSGIVSRSVFLPDVLESKTFCKYIPGEL